MKLIEFFLAEIDVVDDVRSDQWAVTSDYSRAAVQDCHKSDLQEIWDEQGAEQVAPGAWRSPGREYSNFAWWDLSKQEACRDFAKFIDDGHGHGPPTSHGAASYSSDWDWTEGPKALRVYQTYSMKAK